MLPRILEPEVMDTDEDARDYDAMDHAIVNASFCDDLLAFAQEFRKADARVLDVGTGTARIPIALCERTDRAHVDAIDLADSMLRVARSNVEASGFSSRISLELVDAKRIPRQDGVYDCVVSNSIVHHIPDVAAALSEMWRVLKGGGVLFVRDLVRPETDARVTELARTYAPIGESDAGHAARSRQHHLLDASLRAALTLSEVTSVATALGIPSHGLAMTSDRHWTLAARKP